MLFSIFIQSLINELNLLLLFQSSSVNFPFYKNFFILFGNLILSSIISSLQKLSLYLLSISNNNASSLSFIAVLILVNTF